MDTGQIKVLKSIWNGHRCLTTSTSFENNPENIEYKSTN